VTAYYNEIDPDAAHIMRALIADGVIAPGDVDTRSIKEVQADDLRGYTQCHFFAGGGLWSVAARMAGWPDERPLWTGSCPCQPFSIAGKGGGTDDPRHLWPDLLRLIGAVRPPVVVGEQVAGSAGYGWFDGVRADLAGEGFAGRCVDIPACAVDAPHIRQRLYWVAVADAEGFSGGRDLAVGRSEERAAYGRPDAQRPMEHAAGVGRREGQSEPELRRWRPAVAGTDAPSGRVDNPLRVGIRDSVGTYIRV
jgi:DNA (cytosine-5)-methyltransferase 1